jgi:hypothetical protein
MIVHVMDDVEKVLELEDYNHHMVDDRQELVRDIENPLELD